MRRFIVGNLDLAHHGTSAMRRDPPQHVVDESVTSGFASSLVFDLLLRHASRKWRCGSRSPTTMTTAMTMVTTTSTTEFRGEVASHPPEMPRRRIFSTEDCGDVASDLSGISRQMGRYTDGRPRPADPNVCFLCGVEAITYAALVTHVKTTHPQKYDPRVCCICAKRYATVQNHVDLVHRYIRNNKCDVCGKCYFAKCDLMRHQMSVHQKVEFKCTLCPKICTSDGHIRDHYFNVHRSRITFKTPNGPEVADVKLLTPDELRSYHSRHKSRSDQLLEERPRIDDAFKSEISVDNEVSVNNEVTVKSEDNVGNAGQCPTESGSSSATSRGLSSASAPSAIHPVDVVFDGGPSTADSVGGRRKSESSSEGFKLLAKRKPKGAEEIAVVKPTRKKRRSSCAADQQQPLQQRQQRQQQDSPNKQPSQLSSSGGVEQEMSTISLKDLGTDLEALEAFRRRRGVKAEPGEEPGENERWGDSPVEHGEDSDAVEKIKREVIEDETAIIVENDGAAAASPATDDAVAEMTARFIPPWSAIDAGAKSITRGVYAEKGASAFGGLSSSKGVDVQRKLALYECLDCGQRYGHRNLIEYHLVTKHQTPAQDIDSRFKFCFMCTLCDALFPAEAILSLHQERCHPDELAESLLLNESFLTRNGTAPLLRGGGGGGATVAVATASDSPSASSRPSLSTLFSVPPLQRSNSSVSPVSTNTFSVVFTSATTSAIPSPLIQALSEPPQLHFSAIFPSSLPTPTAQLHQPVQQQKQQSTFSSSRNDEESRPVSSTLSESHPVSLTNPTSTSTDSRPVSSGNPAVASPESHSVSAANSASTDATAILPSDLSTLSQSHPVVPLTDPIPNSTESHPVSSTYPTSTIVAVPPINDPNVGVSSRSLLSTASLVNRASSLRSDSVRSQPDLYSISPSSQLAQVEANASSGKGGSDDSRDTSPYTTATTTVTSTSTASLSFSALTKCHRVGASSATEPRS